MKSYKAQDVLMAGVFAGFCMKHPEREYAALFAADETPVWGKWHAVRYHYDRMTDEKIGFDALWITPVKHSPTWVSDSPMGFIVAIRNAVFDLFAKPIVQHGTSFIMRPGTPRPAKLYRIGFNALRVTKVRERS